MINIPINVNIDTTSAPHHHNAPVRNKQRNLTSLTHLLIIRVAHVDYVVHHRYLLGQGRRAWQLCCFTEGDPRYALLLFRSERGTILETSTETKFWKEA